jgi:hypothetical protein
MEPTQSGGALGDLTRLLKKPVDEPRRSRWDNIHWYRKAVIELSIIMVAVISIGLYLIAVIAFARWVL